MRPELLSSTDTKQMPQIKVIQQVLIGIHTMKRNSIQQEIEIQLLESYFI